jgi:hypothetical protein
MLIAPARRKLPGHVPQWGNLKRQAPFSGCYGWDRGQPVDRFYIEAFLSRMAHCVHGDVLEIRDNGYTTRFGQRGHRSHVLDLDPTNKRADIIGDLCDPTTIAAGLFDCVILTQTLQYMPSPGAALANLFGGLRSGGTLLITVPCAARLDQHAPEADYWRWTPTGLRALIETYCPAAESDVDGAGNLIAMLSAMLGLAVEDVAVDDLSDSDPTFPLVACAAVRKPGGAP